MTEIVKIFATVFSQVSLVETAIFLIYCTIGCSVYFFFQVWFPEYTKTKRQEMDREDKKTELMDQTMKNIVVLLQQNTDIIQGLNKSISTLDLTLDKVSDKLHALYEKNKNLEDNIKTLSEEMARFKENTPDLSDINRIHQRIDEIKNNLSDKRDVNLIIQKLDQILDTVAQIKGKMM